MTAAITLHDILRIEDSTEVLAVRCPDTDIPLWPAIRVAFLRTIIGDLVYGTPIAQPPSGAASRARRASAISRAYLHNAGRMLRMRPCYPILTMATGARLLRQDGRYFNCLSDYFIRVEPSRTLAVEEMFDWKWPFPRKHDNTLLHTPLRVSSALRARPRRPRYLARSQELVDLLLQRAERLLDWQASEAQRTWIEAYCVSSAASLLPRYKAYEKLFRKAGIRLLLKEEASYGGPDNVAAISAAKDMGIVTAEYQHGAIFAGHDAYNMAGAMSASADLCRTLPDHLLTYGEWWGEQTNLPLRTHAIGSPHRSEIIGGLTRSTPHKSEILVLGDGLKTDFYLSLCAELAAVLSTDYRVVFRPHPLERSKVFSGISGGIADRVKIDSRPDIYSSFASASALVSELSTGLFEAIGIVPRIFIWDTPVARFTIPSHSFRGFQSAAELITLLSSSETGKVAEEQKERVWKTRWQENYRHFLASVL
ncbi:MAG TPA: hypothetical protein VIM12_17415 [Noviherbaspirillum sp.]|jgi:hypothetical protein|uniref:hypothetical protein n=1 Tax=Noviherbaspirillum sp. TaxID=1926288 RepID=UPI002F922FB4